MVSVAVNFPIPSSLQDLEREPYNLEPYPLDFRNDDETARGESFAQLLHLLKTGNRRLNSGVFASRENDAAQSDSPDDDDDDGEEFFENDAWLDQERLQALYTLVRKSTSLPPSKQEELVDTLCETVHMLVNILVKSKETQSQTFREAWACHLYMLYSLMFLNASAEAVATSSSLKITAAKTPSAHRGDPAFRKRARCAETLRVATVAMAEHAHLLWQRGVPNEAVVLLPVRMALYTLERAAGVTARKSCCGDDALAILAVVYEHIDAARTSVVAGLMDLLHSHEHMASLTAELCAQVCSSGRLAEELLREYGRLETSSTGGAGLCNNSNKASGIKNVAPFLSELASLRPAWVLAQLSHLLGHLEAEPYPLRSALVIALGHLVKHVHQVLTNKDASVQGNLQAAFEKEVKDEEATPAAETEGDAGPSSTKLEQLTKTRTTLLEILIERLHDVSSYTRATVLKTWVSLITGDAIPKEWIVPCTKHAMDRLQDKTVVVRKQSMQLLTTLLMHNPFMGDLNPEPYRQKLSELYDYAQENMPAHIKTAQEASRRDAEDAEDEEALHDLERAALATAMAEVREWDTSIEELTAQQQDFKNKIQALQFTQSALEFIDLFDEEATDNLEGMLRSANTSDVTEALRFFVQARLFKLPCAIKGMKRALGLMWSSEQAIRDEVLRTFVDVIIAQPGTDGKEPLSDKEIATNLLLLTGDASVSDLASIEEAIYQLVKQERIPANVFLVLWSITSKGSGDARAAALQLLSMGASADPSIIDSKSRLKLLLDAGLGDYTRENRNWKLAAAAATALRRTSRARVDPTDAKYLILERILEELSAVVRGDWCQDDEKETGAYFSAAEQSIKAIFVISPQPETVCADILRGMHDATFGREECHSLRLARFCHVLGDVALNMLVYTEALVASVQRANAKKALKKQEDADKAKVQRASAGANAQDENVDDAIEAELGMAAEAEAENERKLADISEHEILNRGLLGPFVPLLVRVVSNEGGIFNLDLLVQVSMLSLCKCMCVSKSFCEKHLPLVFATLANAPKEDITMRANTIVALGDLAFRFPNEVEPYTPLIYACLRDSSTKVRRHTMMVLTHLILNDMVKVKGNVSEIALCLQDQDPRIRDMARLLFHELSKRSNNPVYNLLPDIVSQLSLLPNSKDSFRSIMSFLLGFIKKEKQNEALTEKFVQRFAKCTTVSQKADLAFCLSLLKMNERSIKYLSDNFKLYKDALFDDDVKKSFATIVTKAKKSLKPEIRTFLEQEWEPKLQEMAELGAENEAAGSAANKARAKARRRAARKKNKTLPLGSIDEYDEDEDFEMPENTLPAKKTPPRSARKFARRSQKAA